MDVRLMEVKLRSNSLPADPAAGLDGTEPSRSNTWLTAAGILGVVLASAVLLGLVVRRRRAAGTAPAAGPGKPAERAAAEPAVSFTCSSCGKGLKARAALTGKKVKCPHCGQAGVLKPAGDDGG
jgi:predicted RNA-binding Zn-ribbon protein involved in translation (DUF1610 family)